MVEELKCSFGQMLFNREKLFETTKVRPIFVTGNNDIIIFSSGFEIYAIPIDYWVILSIINESWNFKFMKIGCARVIVLIWFKTGLFHDLPVDKFIDVGESCNIFANIC